MNVAIYARVSTAAQAEHGYSLQTQVDACRKKADELGAESIKEYIDDGYSGAYLERPALDALRDALGAKLHDTVIIYDTDRLARDTMLLLLITEEIEKTATLLYVNSEYSKTPEGQLFYEIRGSFSKYERIKIKDRFMRGKRGKLRKGLPIFNAHVFGYDFVDGNYVVNEKQAEIVRMIFDLYINSLGGYRSVLDVLEKRGIPSPKGLKRWSDYGLQRILKRQQYTGEYFALTIYTKKVGNAKFERIKRDASEWIPMKCPAIISKETFERAQQKSRDNTMKRIRFGKYKSLLQGVLYCASCGRKMLFKHDFRYVGDYYYYRCKAMEVKDKTCQNHAILARLADDGAWSAIKKLCRSEASLNAYLKKKEKPPTDNLQDELEKIIKQRQAVMNWFSADLITAEQSTEKLKMLQKQEKEIRDKMAVQPKEINTAEIVSAVRGRLTFEEKRQFITQYIDKILILKLPSEKGEYNIDFKVVLKS